MKPHFLFVFMMSSFIISGDNRIPLFPGPSTFGTPVGTPPQMYTPTSSQETCEHKFTSLTALYGLASCSFNLPVQKDDMVQVELKRREKALPTLSVAQKDPVGPEFPGTNWTTPPMPQKTDVNQDSQEYGAGCGMYFPK